MPNNVGIGIGIGIGVGVEPLPEMLAKFKKTASFNLSA